MPKEPPFETMLKAAERAVRLKPLSEAPGQAAQQAQRLFLLSSPTATKQLVGNASSFGAGMAVAAAFGAGAAGAAQSAGISVAVGMGVAAAVGVGSLTVAECKTWYAGTKDVERLDAEDLRSRVSPAGGRDRTGVSQRLRGFCEPAQAPGRPSPVGR
jgi:hypothetical protein